MRIKIGEVWTLSVKDWRIAPDDRQELIEVIGGVVVQDFGHCVDGDTISCRISVRQSDAPTLFGYWHERTLVDVVDECGITWSNRRLVIKSYSYRPYFSDVYDAEIKLWGK